MSIGEQSPSNDRRINSTKFLIFTVVFAILATIVFSAGFFTGSIVRAHTLAGSDMGIFPLRQRITGGDPRFPAIPFSDPGADTSADAEADLTVFWEVWNTVENRFYYDIPSEEERVQGAIYGLIESLDDPYTRYVSPDAARIMSEDDSGDFEGIGAYVQEAPEGGVYIVRVFDGGPADEAGIRAGDIIIAVNGVDITKQILNETLLIIRGPAGTDVTLSVYREGEDDLLEFTVTRARLEIPTIEYRVLDDNIGYVWLYDFNAQSSTRLRSAVEELMNQGVDGIVLDLRNNPGGFLDESVAIADMFLPRGVVLIQRDVDGRVREYTSNNGDFAEDIPLVVLINESSASASEIVAAAIKDNGRGVLVGETSFGKGSVQLQYVLSDESLLRVTYSNWYTPNDVSITGNGVEPDFVIEMTEDQVNGDPQLDRAVEYLLTGK